MQEATYCIGKRLFTNKTAALKALKKLERRINKRLEKEKLRKLIDHEDE